MSVKSGSPSFGCGGRGARYTSTRGPSRKRNARNRPTCIILRSISRSQYNSQSMDFCECLSTCLYPFGGMRPIVLCYKKFFLKIYKHVDAIIHVETNGSVSPTSMKISRNRMQARLNISRSILQDSKIF